MPYGHAVMAAGRWREFTLAEQMANIGSEVHRSLVWRTSRDESVDPERRASCESRMRGAMERALELMDLTFQDPPRPAIRKELGRVREAFAYIWFGEVWCGVTLEALDKYFDQFTHVVARRRERTSQSL